MNQKIVGALVCAGAASVASAGSVASFEDVETRISAPFVSGGLMFDASLTANSVFAPGTFGAQNGTNRFGWCGSVCGETQVITVTGTSGFGFDLLSIDAGNLDPRSTPLGFRDGMTIELTGFLSGGGTVTESLLIVEDVLTTFLLSGFTDLVSVEITSPATSDGNPDGVIDNLVYRDVPATGTFVTMAICGLAAARRRR